MTPVTLLVLPKADATPNKNLVIGCSVASISTKRNRERVCGPPRSTSQRARKTVCPGHDPAPGSRRPANRETAQVVARYLRTGGVMTAKPKTHQGDLAHLPTALQPLTEQERAVVWRWELRKTKSGKEKWTKPPYQARDPHRPAKSNDPKTWAPYQCALDAVQ